MIYVVLYLKDLKTESNIVSRLRVVCAGLYFEETVAGDLIRIQYAENDRDSLLYYCGDICF